MAFDLDIPRKQAIANLGLSTRDTAGVPTYDTTMGDTSYSAGQMTRAIQSAVTEIMRAICETDGHQHRTLFTTSTALTHGSVLPAHLGSIGVPRITPFSGATFTITGKVKSIEEISAYRANVNNRYSSVAYNSSSGGNPSKLAGFYGIDGATNVIYFTGFSAVADITNFQESDYTLLPDMYYPLATDGAIKFLRTDGDISDIFTPYEQSFVDGIAKIRGRELDQPSMKKTIGSRDNGMK